MYSLGSPVDHPDKGARWRILSLGGTYPKRVGMHLGMYSVPQYCSGIFYQPHDLSTMVILRQVLGLMEVSFSMTFA